MLEFFGISQGWKLMGAIKMAERKLADGSLRHSGQGLMSWAVANARVEPKGNAIIITRYLGHLRPDSSITKSVGPIEPL